MRNKLFGFRSGKLYKKLIAVSYLVFMALAFIGVLSTTNEIAVSPNDIIVTKLSNFIILFAFFVPYLILSNIFGLRAKLPFFKSYKKPRTIFALFLSTMIIGIAGGAVTDLTTQDYKDNFIKHEEQLSQTSNLQEPDVAVVASENTDSDNYEHIVDSEIKQDSVIFEIFNNDILAQNLVSACDETGIKTNKIKNLKKVDDWVAGERYSFSYQNLPLRIYCNMDYTIRAIKLGTSTNIYKQGFEPYNISNYIVTSEYINTLRSTSEEMVKTQLNYPSSGKLPWFDWSYSRDGNIYTVSSTVTAKNAFGVESENPFCVKFYVPIDSSSIKPIYFDLSGNVLIDNLANYVTPERIALVADSEAIIENDEITLIDGELGKYGEKVVLDGDEYIHYFLPAGKYNVTNNIKQAYVFLDENNTIKNSSGYTEHINVETLKFTKFGETQTLTIGENHHIFLTYLANVTIVPIV